MKFILTTSIIFLISCGAPVKKADQVPEIFADAKQIDEKYADLCKVLSSRSVNPNLKGLDLAEESCANPKVEAVNYASLSDRMDFSEVRKERIGEGENAFLSIQTASELWIDSSVLELANLVFGDFADKAFDVKKNGSGESRNQDMRIEVIGDPKFDKEEKKFNLKIRLVSSREQNGLVDIDNELQIEGQLFDNNLAFTATSTENADVKTSLIEKVKIGGKLFFHNEIIRFDLFTHFMFHSFGVDSIMEQEIVKTLEKSLKSIPDLFDDLN